MLELKDIIKIYPAGGDDVKALKGVSLKFRSNEFVSILGQSGCGKTTMLNIIGGLDQYTEGDLIINGTSTKKYKDRDWDAYRNHSVGFVFQSYNLIPHQTVLQNVELALTLSGVKKAERKRRALEALEKVGLSDQIKKRPSEMSGGQMQRVAIARAIVNNPDIILADEPTGALDTETSVQVMEILKEIAKDRLVVMVTHNPELAEKYSTRIVRMLDGKIIDDSMPWTEADEAKEQNLIAEKEAAKKGKKQKLPSMSFATSFGLSLKNLFTKKGRTALTSFAGSIGIIGIALIYAVSQGTTNYINFIQEQTLSSYPLTIESTTVDLTSLMTTFMGLAESTSEHENDAVYQKAMVYELINAMTSLEATENDLKSFKEFLESEKANEGSELSEALSAIKYSYNLNFTVFTENVDGKIIKSDTSELMMELLAEMRGISSSTLASLYSSSDSSTSSYTSSLMSSSSLWAELVPGENDEAVSEVTKKQYDLVGEGSRWPENYNEIVLFVDENNELDDLTLYALGLTSEEDIRSIISSAINKEKIEYEVKKWSYEDIMNMEFKTVIPSSYYSYDSETGTYTDLSQTETGLKYIYDNAIALKVVGIAKPNEDAISSTSSSAIGYTHLLTEYIINEANNSEIVKYQQENPDTDVLTGLSFKPEEELDNAEKAQQILAYIEKLSDEEKAQFYIKLAGIPSDEDVESYVSAITSQMTREQIAELAVSTYTTEMALDEETVRNYIATMSDEELFGAFKESAAEQFKEEYAAQVAASCENMTTEQLTAALNQILSALDNDTLAGYYDELIEFSTSTYEDNLISFGCLDLDTPSSISLYTATFEGKDTIKAAIEDYNESVDEVHKIEYTDLIGIFMSSVTMIINAITYVLIAFVSVSLIVSSIMIGVITLISVQERTKEIGILRAIGASKKNVSGMFNAETIIIGLISGVMGVLITYILCIPINAILHSLTNINNLSATLPISFALILVAISCLLTVFAGIIPSRSAAKKDPVVALRTE